MTGFGPTKEQVVAALALVLALLTIRSRLSTPVTPAPVPKPPAREAPADVDKDEIPVAKPRVLATEIKERATEGRDPFAASDIWEDPKPVAIPLPPELPQDRIVPILSLGGGRVRAPHPPRIRALPKVVSETASMDAASEAPAGAQDAAPAPAAPAPGMGGGPAPATGRKP